MQSQPSTDDEYNYVKQKMLDIVLYILILKEECPAEFTVPFNVILVSICDLFHFNTSKDAFLTRAEARYARNKAKHLDFSPTSRIRNRIGGKPGKSAYEISLLNSFLELNCPPSSESQHPTRFLPFIILLFSSFSS